MKFEQYMMETLQEICQGKPVDRKLFEARIQVYLGLVVKGVEAAKARRIMDLYLE